MTQDVHGFEDKGDASPWCVQCATCRKWPYHDECLGCLTVGGRPAETVSFRTVHWDVAVVQAVIRRKVAVWEQRHPGWELVPDMQRYWEDSTHPSKYVDRETGIGRKLAWTRLRVERRHPRGDRRMGQVAVQRGVSGLGPWGLEWVEQEAGVGLRRPVPGGVEAYRFDRDLLLQGVRPMAEPTAPTEPTEPPEPDDVPEPAPPAPAEDEEAEETPA
jgi:hypothetical protein